MSVTDHRRSLLRPQLHVCLCSVQVDGKSSLGVRAVASAEKKFRPNSGKLHGKLLALQSQVATKATAAGDQEETEENFSFIVSQDGLDAALRESSRDAIHHDDTASELGQRATLQAKFKAWMETKAKTKGVDSDCIAVHDDPHNMGQRLAEAISSGWKLTQPMPSKFSLSSLVRLEGCSTCSVHCSRQIRHPIDGALLADLKTAGMVMLTFVHQSLSAEGSRKHALECVLISDTDSYKPDDLEIQSVLGRFRFQRSRVHDALATQPIADKLLHWTHTTASLGKIQTVFSWVIDPFSDQGSDQDSLLAVPPNRSGYMTNRDDIMRLMHYCAENPVKWAIASTLTPINMSSVMSINTICDRFMISPDSLPEYQ